MQDKELTKDKIKFNVLAKITLEEAKELFLQDSEIWTPIECSCSEDEDNCQEQHYTTISLDLGDELEDLENKELFEEIITN